MIENISYVVYGLKTDSLKNPNNSFKHFGKRAFQWGKMKMLCGIFMPKLLETLHMSFFHKEVIEFFNNIFKQTIDQHKKEQIVQNVCLNTLLKLMEDDTLETEEKSNHTIQSSTGISINFNKKYYTI